MRHALPFFALFFAVACDSGGSDMAPGGGGGSSGASGSSGDGDGDENVPQEERATDAAREQINDYVCSVFDACGGDPVGEWTTRELGCNSEILDLAFDGLPNCRGVLTAYENGLVGSIKLGRNGEVELDFRYPGTRETVLDSECLEREYGSPDEEGCLLHEIATGSGDTHETTCEYRNERCECTTEVNVTYAGSGTYTLSDGGRAIDDGATESPFCVAGDTLTIQFTEPDGSYSEATFQRVVVLTECTDHSDCEGGLSCCFNAKGERTCEEPPVPDAMGDTPPVLCPEGLMASPSPNAKPCVSDYHCASRACIDGECSVPPVIPDPVADGEPCTQDGECQSGSCYLGACVAPGAFGAVCAAGGDCDSSECCTDGLSPALCGGGALGCPGQVIDKCVHDDDCGYSGEGGTCVDETFCSHECGEGLPECLQAVNASYTFCVDALCRMECELDEDCHDWLGSQYSCVAAQAWVEGETQQVNVCMR